MVFNAIVNNISVISWRSERWKNLLEKTSVLSFMFRKELGDEHHYILNVPNLLMKHNFILITFMKNRHNVRFCTLCSRRN